jgi:pimeloyl-ACP methyl ester carboxylesterase
LTFATDTIELLDRLGLERVRLVGHDWGGFTALLPRSYIAGFERHAPGLEVEFVAGCGHFLPEERPDLAVSRLRESWPDRTGCSFRT